MSETPSYFDQPDSHRELALEVEGRKFWVSRGALASFSPVFKAMLYGEFAESKKDTIPLPDKKADEVEELLRCLFPSPTTKPVDDSNFEVLLAFSDQYQMDEMRWKVERFMLENLQWALGKSDQQLLRILSIGSKYKLKAVLQECVKRCAMEFGLDKLKSHFPELPSDVVASLVLYACQIAVPKENTAVRYCCSYFRIQVYSRGICGICSGTVQDRTAAQCLHCGSIVCANCVSAGRLVNRECSGTLKNEPEARVMLERYVI